MITEQEYQRYLTDIIDSWPKLDVSLAGGIRKGELICATASRLTGKSGFSGIFLGGELPDEYSSLRGGGKTCLGEDLLYRELFGRSLWEEPEYILMKTSSKQSRYVRVWRNK